MLLWVSRRAAGVRSLQLDFDDWCRRYYQGCFSAIQASRTVTDMLQLLQNSLQQLKLSDSGYVVNRDVLRSISALHQLQHLQLFGMSSHLLVSSDLGLLTSLLQLRNLELSDSDEARPVVQMQHPHFFPVEVCSLAQLVRLHIQSPLVTHIDPGITRLRNLRTLMVNSCSIQQIPPFLTKLTQLDTIDFSDNDELAQNKIVEQWWPEELAGLTSLTDLNLSCCSLSSVPMCWTRLHRLRHLDLSTNAAHPLLMLPSMLTSCTSLECLKLLDLGLTFVPLSVCKMTSLRVLLLTNNELQTLPIEMAALSQLQDLDVGHNEFQTFPMVLTSLLSLERISMEGCTQMQITCSIKEMSRLTCLTSLVLTCDMSRVEPRWSADSTSRLVSLACSLDRLQIGKADMLRF